MNSSDFENQKEARCAKGVGKADFNCHFLSDHSVLTTTTNNNNNNNKDAKADADAAAATLCKSFLDKRRLALQLEFQSLFTF